jgi:hypothetical protein
MPFESWRAFYQSDLQGVWSLLPVPAAFLVLLLLSGRAREAGAGSPEARFVRAWAVLFAVETLLDPLIGGKLVSGLGAPPLVGTAVMLAFVLLGDFRIYWLVLALALRDAPRGARLAAAATPVVPLLAFASDRLVERFAPDPTGQRLWLTHELLFTAVALWLGGRWLPGRVESPATRRFLRRVCAYVALYYGLWAGCDALWLATSLDAVWLLRAVPNQLYYAFTVPFVWLAYSRRG